MIYVSIYDGPFHKPNGETIVCDVPRYIAKLLPKEFCGVGLCWSYLHRVWVRAPFRRAGLGSRLMRETLMATDAMRQSLVLRCHPFQDSMLVKQKQKLREWYLGFGFRPVDLDHQDILIRRVT